MTDPVDSDRGNAANAAAAAADSADDLVRFGQFVAWLIAAVFTFGTLQLLAAFIFGQPWIGVTGGLCLIYGACLLYARRLLQGGRLRPAVLLTALGLLVLIAVGAPVLPIIYPTLILLPFVVVALALPYLEQRHMRWLVGVAWTVGVVIAVIGNLLPPSPALPPWFVEAFRISSVAAGLALAFLLLWQYTRRLNDALAQSRSAYLELQDQVTRRAEAEAALANSEKRFRALIENSSDAVLLVGAAGQLRYASPAAERLLGLAARPAPGPTGPISAAAQADPLALIHPDDHGLVLGRLDEVRQLPGRTLPMQYRLRDQEGAWRWVAATVQNLLDEPGVQAFVFNFHDISERRHAEEQLRGRLAELEAVNHVSKALRTAATMDEMLNVWLDVTLELMGAKGGSVWLHDPAKDELRPAVMRGWTEPPGAGPVRPQRPGTGVIGHTFLSGQPYLSSNFQTDPQVAEDTRRRIPPGGGASIPIPVGDRVIGTFTVNLPPGRLVAPGDVSLLTTLAEIAGSAIQRIRYFEQMEQRLGQVSALRAIDLTITASLDLRVTLGVVLEQVVIQLKVAAADILLFNPTAQTLHYAVGRGFATGNYRDLQLPAGASRAGRVVMERQVLVVADMGVGIPLSHRTAPLLKEGFVGYVGAPLIAKGQVLGVLEMFQRAPFRPDVAWLEFLEALAGQAAIAVDNARLFENLQQSNQELVVAYDKTIEGWSAALDLRDKETEGHSQRVTEMTLQLADTLSLGPQQLVHLRRGALLHDIGKMGIPDSILFKPGPLTKEEWAIMRQHPAYAYLLLEPIRFLRPALEIPYCHHERWDGSGYPQGLAGEQIPLAARVFAVVDVWDALRSDRPYRPAWPMAQVLDYIREQSGRHFDPAVVEAFLSLNSSERR